MKTSFLLLRLMLLLFLWVVAAQSLLAQDKGKWLPLDPQELAASQPQVEPDADAEVLFWQVRITESREAIRTDNYIRLKVFTERGRELNSKISLPFGDASRFTTEIKDLAARTIAPDGRVEEVKPQDIYESEQVKVRGLKAKAKTFALPNLKVGSVVEYRWRENKLPSTIFFSGYLVLSFGISAEGERFEVQREFPVRRVTYYINPINSRAPTGKVFNWPQQPQLVKQGDDYTFTLENLPAVRVEPFMPPDDQAQAWFMYYQRKDITPSAMLAWLVQRGSSDNKELKKQADNDNFKRTVREVVGNTVDPVTKLRLIFDYCRAKVRNLSDPTQRLTEKEQKDYPINPSLSDILKRGMGYQAQINQLFMGLALAAGLDARLVLASNRRESFFDFTFPRPRLLTFSLVAVKVGEEWHFFQPGDPYTNFGRLRWEKEGVTALIPQDEKEALTLLTPISSADKSQALRHAQLSLSEDGTLAGDVEIIYSGHQAVALKEEYAATSSIERERDWTASLKQRLGAEITKFQMENIAANSELVKIAFHLRAVNYAQRTGKRMFLTPAVFQRGLGAVFPNSQRKQDVYFHYAEQETDSITFALPAGYVLDTPTAPRNLATDLLRYQVQVRHTPDQKQLSYRRHFVLGVGPQKNLLLYGPENYPTLKKLFDDVHQQDAHIIVLQRKE